MIGALIANLAICFYILSAAGYLVFIFRQNMRAIQGAVWLIRLGFILQCISLILRTASLGQLPVINVTEALGFFAWTLVGVYLLLSVRFDIPALGAFVSPLAALTILLSLLIPVKPLVMAPVFQSIWLTVHLGTVFIGYGFFSLAFVAGVMYLIQEHQIKAKLTGGIYRRFPSLNALDTLNYYSLTMGFPMITLGIIFGAVYAQLSLGKYWRWDPKEVWSLITWLIYAALLHQRLTVGWRGRRAALLSIAGFLVLCFTFLGVSFLLPSYHSFESLEQLQTK